MIFGLFVAYCLCSLFGAWMMKDGLIVDWRGKPEKRREILLEYLICVAIYLPGVIYFGLCEGEDKVPVRRVIWHLS